MNPFANVGDRIQIVLPHNGNNKGQTAWAQNKEILREFTGIAPKARSWQVPAINQNARYSQIIQESKTMGTDFGNAIRIIPQSGWQNMNLDIKIGKTVREAIDGLRSLYTFRDPDLVGQLLSSNNTIRGMLPKIYSNIRKEFPSEKINLDVLSDLPYSNEMDLVVSVVTSLPVDEAVDRLDRVEDVRWNRDSRDPYVNICVNLEYL